MSQFLPHNVLILLAAERMHKSPPHLSYVATLPKNTLATEWSHCFSAGCVP